MDQNGRGRFLIYINSAIRLMAKRDCMIIRSLLSLLVTSVVALIANDAAVAGDPHGRFRHIAARPHTQQRRRTFHPDPVEAIAEARQGKRRQS
jgi:hypothetical protein